MITTPNGKKFVRELTLEYIKQNNLLKCEKKDIPKQIDKIVEIENIISNSVEKKLKYFESIQNL